MLECFTDGVFPRTLLLKIESADVYAVSTNQYCGMCVGVWKSSASHDAKGYLNSKVEFAKEESTLIYKSNIFLTLTIVHFI